MLSFLTDLFGGQQNQNDEEIRRREEAQQRQAEMAKQNQAQSQEQQEAQRRYEEQQKRAAAAKVPQFAPMAGINFGQAAASQGAMPVANNQPIPFATFAATEANRGSGNPNVSAPMPEFGRQQPTNNVKVPPQMNLGAPAQPVFVDEGPSVLEQIMGALQSGQKGQNPFDKLLGNREANQLRSIGRNEGRAPIVEALNGQNNPQMQSNMPVTQQPMQPNAIFRAQTNSQAMQPNAIFRSQQNQPIKQNIAIPQHALMQNVTPTIAPPATPQQQQQVAQAVQAVKNAYGLNEQFYGQLQPLIKELEAMGFQPKIAEGRRTLEQQAEKVRKGYSKTMNSNHLHGNAADIIDKRWGWSQAAIDNGFNKALGDLAAKYGLGWGGQWKSFGPHGDWAHVQFKKTR